MSKYFEMFFFPALPEFTSLVHKCKILILKGRFLGARPPFYARLLTHNVFPSEIYLLLLFLIFLLSQTGNILLVLFIFIGIFHYYH